MNVKKKLTQTRVWIDLEYLFLMKKVFINFER